MDQYSYISPNIKSYNYMNAINDKANEESKIYYMENESHVIVSQGQQQSIINNDHGEIVSDNTVNGAITNSESHVNIIMQTIPQLLDKQYSETVAVTLENNTSIIANDIFQQPIEHCATTRNICDNNLVEQPQFSIIVHDNQNQPLQSLQLPHNTVLQLQDQHIETVRHLLPVSDVSDYQQLQPDLTDYQPTSSGVVEYPHTVIIDEGPSLSISEDVNLGIPEDVSLGISEGVNLAIPEDGNLAISENVNFLYINPTNLNPDQVLNKKKRRRIVQLNEDDSDDDDIEDRMEILRSVSPNFQTQLNGTVTQNDLNDDEDDHDDDDDDDDDGTDGRDGLARTLLQNVVLIPADTSDCRRKKIRILESDEECVENDLQDIGLEGDYIDGLEQTDILLNENVDSDTNYITMEGVAMNEIEEFVPIENPIIYSDDDDDEQYEESEENAASAVIQDTSDARLAMTGAEAVDGANEVDDNNTTEHTTHGQSEHGSETNKSGNDKDYEESEQDNNQSENDSQPSTSLGETSSNATNEVSEVIKAIQGPVVKTIKHKKDAPKKVKKEKKRKIRNLNDSSSEEEFIPNEIYFGTPDKVIVNSRGRGRPRGRPPSHNSSRKNSKRPKDKRRKESYKRNTDSSSSEESSSSSESDTSSDSEDMGKIPQKKSRPTVTLVNKVFHTVLDKKKKQKKNKKKDRFYDRSLAIPNEIYFGNVDVPLHVLYSYGASSGSNKSDSSSASEGELKNKPQYWSTNRGRPRAKEAQRSTQQKKISNGARSKTPNLALSPDNDTSIQTMKHYLKIAGLKKVKYNKLWEGCKSNEERVTAILRLLREKGLEGEPTIAKCRELKQQIQTKKEIEELDTSVILPTEGRTRRSTRGAAASTSKTPYTVDLEVDGLETLKKIKNVIDSDSDVD